MINDIERSKKYPENKVPFIIAGETYMVDYIDERSFGRAGIEYSNSSDEERQKNRARLMEICYDIIQNGKYTI